jgi:hypothetical protein
MNASPTEVVTRIHESGARRRAKTTWSVVVVYEDAPARERAVVFCDQLVGRFWAQLEFDIDWCSFASLKESQSAKAAADKVTRADLIVFCAVPEGNLPAPVKAWVETWIEERGEREGMLIGLLEPPGAPCVLEGEKHHYFRQVAHRGAMDYLTHLPQEIMRPIPDSLDWYTQRADKVTSLLEGILHQQSPPPHLLS